MVDGADALKDAEFQLNIYSPLVENVNFTSSSHGLIPLLLELRFSANDGETSAIVEHVQYVST